MPSLQMTQPNLTVLAYQSSWSVAREWWSTCVEYGQHFTAHKKWARKSTGRFSRCLWTYPTQMITTDCLRRKKVTTAWMMRKHAHVLLEFLVGIMGTKFSWWHSSVSEWCSEFILRKKNNYSKFICVDVAMLAPLNWWRSRYEPRGDPHD